VTISHRVEICFFWFLVQIHIWAIWAISRSDIAELSFNPGPYLSNGSVTTFHIIEACANKDGAITFCLTCRFRASIFTYTWGASCSYATCMQASWRRRLFSVSAGRLQPSRCPTVSYSIKSEKTFIWKVSMKRNAIIMFVGIIIILFNCKWILPGGSGTIIRHSTKIHKQ
jgi:hypothetical protein